jgi:glutathione S-transferase
MTLVIETTRGCMRTPLILFALEEVAAPHEIAIRDAGHFERTHHTLGPMLRDGDFVLLELDAMLRHLARSRGGGTLMPDDPRETATVDRYMELQATARLAAVRVLTARSSPPEDAIATVRRCLAALEQALEGRDHLIGRFSVADLHAPVIGHLAGSAFGLADFPAVAAWAARVAARPTWRRAEARAAELREVAA